MAFLSDTLSRVKPSPTIAVSTKAAELKALGVGVLNVVQENDPSQFAISLGAFKTEEAANNTLAQLRQKGVRSAVAGPRGAKTSIFVIRDPRDQRPTRQQTRTKDI